MDVIGNYLRQLKRELKTDRETKKKIIEDIRSDIEMYISNGKTAKEAMEIVGEPKEVAKEFNLSYPEYATNKRRHIMRAVAIVCLIIAASCLLIGLVGRFTYFESDQVSQIGGADLPEQVIVTVEPISSLSLFDGLIKLSIYLFVFAAMCVGYLIIKSKNKDDIE